MALPSPLTDALALILLRYRLVLERGQTQSGSDVKVDLRLDCGSAGDVREAEF